MHFLLQLRAVLFLLIFLVSNASSSEQEDYQKMKLRKVPMLQAIKDNNLLHSYGKEKVLKAFEPFVMETSEKKASSNQPYNYLWDWSYNANNDAEEMAKTVDHFTIENKDEKNRASSNQPAYNYLWDWSYNNNNANKAEEEEQEEEEKKRASSNKPYNYLWDWSYEANHNNDEEQNKKASSNKPYNYLWDWSYDAKNAQKKGKSIEPYFSIESNNLVNYWRYNNNANKAEEEEEKKRASSNKPYNYPWDWSYDAKKAQKKGKSNEHYFSIESNNNLVNYWRYNNAKKKAKVTEPSLFSSTINTNEISHHHHLQDELLTGGSAFFMEKSLHLGLKLKHDFQKSPKQVPLLPKHIVQSFPFSVDKFNEILSLFSVKSESMEANAIKDTLDVCFNRPKVKKENRTCAQSMEDIVGFVVGELGTNEVELKMMMRNNNEVPNGVQDYAITKLKKLVVPRNTAVACHRVSYPYAVYYCHHQQDIGHYDVTLVSKTLGPTIQTTAVCHYDTYAWDPNSPALRRLGIRPGDATVCHLSAIHDMFWTLEVDSLKSLNMAQ